MIEVGCLLLWLACIGVACLVDMNAQKHIQKGLDESWK